MTSSTKERSPQPRKNDTAAGDRKGKAKAKAPSRLDQLEQMVTRDNGASIAEMTEATGWQQHSVRGALAGALKKRGLWISSEKIDGVRRYRASAPAQ